MSIKELIVLRVYFAKPNFRNVGDDLNDFIFERIFGLYSEVCSNKTAHLYGIGSILQNMVCDVKIHQRYLDGFDGYSSMPIYIYSTGFIQNFISSPPQGKRFKRPVKIQALRGKLTQQMVIDMGYTEANNVVLADAGLLSPLLISPQQKKYKLGVIPHYVDKKNPTMLKLAEQENNIFIDVQQPLLACLRQIAQCEAVVSSSLHGLIISDSFNIPNKWVECSDRVTGAGFKFEDYYSAYDIYNVKALDFRNPETAQIPTINQIIDDYQVLFTEVKLKQQQLLNAFPFKL